MRDRKMESLGLTGVNEVSSALQYKIVAGLRACQPGVISRGTRGNAVHIVKVIKNALWTAFRTIFRPKML